MLSREADLTGPRVVVCGVHSDIFSRRCTLGFHRVRINDTPPGIGWNGNAAPDARKVRAHIVRSLTHDDGPGGLKTVKFARPVSNRAFLFPATSGRLPSKSASANFLLPRRFLPAECSP
jgi:hypothetical protein